MSDHPIEITIDSRIQSGKEKESTNYSVQGNLVEKGEALYLRYEESLEIGKVSTTVKIDKEQVTVIRRGALSMRQQFAPGQVSESLYKTPFGSMPMQIRTERIEQLVDKEKLKGRLTLRYLLNLEEDETQRHELSLSWKGASQ
ncbi:DUF1934 domain-containing protein [Guptibacillus hwajinpoensis]|uniref:DUF1934 domain-containing protein n=1 Tax=Guptibacillus hwajinpoensis TaxID=208199 RepID=UPI001CFEA129|nr:DUF1934 domain-containing protein [Pseudalkalibacillus hwajinpoensis]WLR61699.1 DUF1934 domain-containing protein [Pseudalkalibacillus hwajinpoensis]